MAKIHTDLKDQVVHYLLDNPRLSSSEIHIGAGGSAAYATIKRLLQTLVKENVVLAHGTGRGTKYSVNPAWQFLRPVNVATYFSKEIDEREGRHYNYGLLGQLRTTALFTSTEMETLNRLQETFRSHMAILTLDEFQREFERLAIDLSWKSSQIEGNTYTLLETERLLKEHLTAEGKTREEASMLMNHKVALDFLVEHPDFIDPLTIARIEDIHRLLVKDMSITPNLREHGVGITGTNYRPPDNVHQVRDALHELCSLVAVKENVFEKALLALLLISYIQPFADGNKRTGRILCNALLMYHQYCPLSFRTVDPMDYKKALLVFYEQNNISAFKKIFMEQFEFAVGTYF